MDRLYPPKQPQTLTARETTSAKTNQAEATAVEGAEVKVKPSLSMNQLSRKISLKETLLQVGQQCEEMELRIQELEDQISNLRSEKEQMMDRLNEQIQHLQSKLEEKVTLINQQEDRLSTSKTESAKLHNELREKQQEIDTTKEEF